jgi:hypothetical protein
LFGFGTVKDQQGGVLPGATISVVNTGTSAMREATTTGERGHLGLRGGRGRCGE